MSLWQIAQAAVLISTSPGPGSASSTVSMVSGAPKARQTAALVFMGGPAERITASNQGFATSGLKIKRSLDVGAMNFCGTARSSLTLRARAKGSSPRPGDRMIARRRLIKNNLASHSLEVDGDGAQLRQRMADRLVPILRREEGEETAGAGAQNLAPDGAMLSRRVVPVVDLGGGDARRHVALEHPGFMQNLAERIQIVVPDFVQELIAERRPSASLRISCRYWSPAPLIGV